MAITKKELLEVISGYRENYRGTATRVIRRGNNSNSVIISLRGEFSLKLADAAYGYMEYCEEQELLQGMLPDPGIPGKAKKAQAAKAAKKNPLFPAAVIYADGGPEAEDEWEYRILIPDAWDGPEFQAFPSGEQ